MSDFFFDEIDRQQARRHDGYMDLWQAKRSETDGIIRYINQLTEKRIITRDSLRLAIKMNSNKLSDFLNHKLPHKVLKADAIRRLAYGIISLLPDLVRDEQFEKEFHNKTNTSRTHAFPDLESLQEERKRFCEAFGPTGFYLIYQLKDFSSVKRVLDYFYKCVKGEITTSKHHKKNQKYYDKRHIHTRSHHPADGDLETTGTHASADAETAQALPGREQMDDPGRHLPLSLLL